MGAQKPSEYVKLVCLTQSWSVSFGEYAVFFPKYTCN